MKTNEYRIIPDLDRNENLIWTLQIHKRFLFWKYWDEIASSYYKDKLIDKLLELKSGPIYYEDIINKTK